MTRPFLRRSVAGAVALAFALTSTVTAGAVTKHKAPKGLTFAVTKLPAGGGEPNVSISPDGKTVLVDGLNGSPASFWRSTNSGRTFAKITPQFPKSGGGDFDMRWIDNHTVVAADLALSDGIYVHRSVDGGMTWTTTTIFTDVYDRPWLGVSGNHVYVITKGFDEVPYCYISTDGGVTFAPTPIPIYGTGTVPAEAGGGSPNAAEMLLATNTYIDHVATDPRTGDLYVLYGLSGAQAFSPTNPLGTPNRLYVAHLETGEAGVQQFVSHAVYLGGAGDGFIDGFNWLTIDRQGTLYVLGNGLHAGHESLWLSYSRDRGVTWSALTDLGEAGATNVYGSIAAGAPGTLALVYLRGTTTNPSAPQPWYAQMARVTAANTASPRIQRVRPVKLPIHTQDICFSGIVCGLPGFGNNRDLLDYIWDAIAPDGTAFAVVASDGPASPGHGVSVIVLRQTGGPKFGPGVPS